MKANFKTLKIMTEHVSAHKVKLKINLRKLVWSFPKALEITLSPYEGFIQLFMCPPAQGVKVLILHAQSLTDK